MQFRQGVSNITHCFLYGTGARSCGTMHGMDMIQPIVDTMPLAEAAAVRQRRIAWETARIAEADADIAAGRLIDAADVDGWIDSIGSEHELPVPYTRR